MGTQGTQEVDLTICICTKNRSAELKRTLVCLSSLRIPDLLNWELLIVDNGSVDDTLTIAKSFQTSLPIRCISESKPGVSNARNLAISEYRSDVLYFLDDDVDVEPDWLEQTWGAIQANPSFAVYGGKVIPKWDVSPPKWFSENYWRIHSNPHVDLGLSNVVFEHPAVAKLIGANLGFRRILFDEGMRFRTDLGQHGDAKGRSIGVGGEEIEIQERALRDGHRCLYIADSVTHHRDAPSRMTLKYVLCWYYRSGRSEVRTGEFAAGKGSWAGAPRYLYRALIINVAKCIRGFLSAGTAGWLFPLTHASRLAGAIVEFHSRVQTRKSMDHPNLR